MMNFDHHEKAAYWVLLTDQNNRCMSADLVK